MADALNLLGCLGHSRGYSDWVLSCAVAAASILDTVEQGHMQYDKIGAIQLSDKLGYVNSANQPVLENLETINLFVGPNNAGKSRLLRGIFNSEELRYWPANLDWEEPKAKLKEVNSAVLSALDGNVSRIIGYGPLQQNSFSTWANQEWLSEGDQSLQKLQKFTKGLLATTHFNPATRGVATASAEDAERIHRNLLPQFRELDGLIAAYEAPTAVAARCYIPILRGLREVERQPDAEQPDCYARRTRKDYQLPENQPQRTVFTGLKMFRELRSLLLGKREDRQRVDEYERFLSRTLFDGRTLELTPNEGDDVIHVNLEGDAERPIHQLGDGMQSLIILTFRAFTADAPTLFFIEEPESNLHPGMQRKLLEVFSSEPHLNRHQYFMTTHSNHMLDMAADYAKCSTYLVRKNPTQTPPFRVHNVSSRDRGTLEALGARASSVFLTNATIWVEGVTDRRYLREYLRKYLASVYPTLLLSEDTHYSFMEAGGANVVHFDFSKDETTDDDAGAVKKLIQVASICSHSFLVLDGDNRNREKRLNSLKAALGERLFITKGKEIENLLPPTVLKAYVAKQDPTLDRVRIADGYQNSMEPLGKWLDQQLGSNRFEDGQTIKNKDGLCTFAVKYMNENEDWLLCDDATQLCEKLVRFIAGANGKDLPERESKKG